MANSYTSSLDLPSVVSGDTIGFFDPHEKYVYEGKSGRSYEFKDAYAYPDQFAPFNVLNCSVSDEFYNGTLFRFPLRTDGQSSDLSKSCHSPITIRELFESFKADAHLVPLFLKSVASIKILEWTPAAKDPEEIFSVVINDATKQGVFEARKSIENGLIQGIAVVQKTFEAGVTCCGRGLAPVTQQWFVVHYVSHNNDQVAEIAAELKQLPWVGLALPLEPLTEQATNLGRVFCFLPLPPSDDDDSNTGLPVHVHGSFSVANNRRSLKWPAEDRKSDTKAKWNYLLLEHLVVPAYLLLITEAVSRQFEPRSVYQAWPEPDSVKFHWKKNVLSRLLFSLLRCNVLWTDAQGGKWVCLSDAIISPSLHCSQDEVTAVKEMIAIEKSVVLAPENVVAGLKFVSAPYKRFDSRFVRSALKESVHYLSLSRDEKLSLLCFALEDEAYREMAGLCLLPLEDKSFSEFQVGFYWNQECIYIPDADCPSSLFPGLESKFLDMTIGPKLLKMLKSKNCCSTLLLKHLQPEHVPSLLRTVVERSWFHESQATVNWSPGKHGQPSKEWVEKVWGWLKNHRSYMKKMVGCTILPYSSCTRMAKLVYQKNLIFVYHKSAPYVSLAPSLASGLTKAGCIVLNNCPDYIISNADITEFVWTPMKVLTCVSQLPVKTAFCNWSNDESLKMLSLLCQVIGSDLPRTHLQMKALYHLPLFCLYGSNIRVSLNRCNRFVPQELQHDLPIVSDLLAYPSHEESTVLQYVSESRITRFSFSKLLQTVVFPDFQSYSIEDKTVIITYLLDNSHLLESYTKKLMANLAFVPVSDGTVKKPCHLFKPLNLLLKLFAGKPLFPDEIFKADTRYGRLLASVVSFRELSSITAGELVDIAEEASKEASKGRLAKGAALLQLLSSYEWARSLLRERVLRRGAQSWSTAQAELKRLAWCPIEYKAPDSYPSFIMPWKARSITSIPTSVVCTFDVMAVSLEKLSCLVGSSAQIIKGGTVSTRDLFPMLGFRLPTINDVVTHWEMAIDCYRSNQSSCCQKFSDMMEIFFDLLSSFASLYWDFPSLKQEITKRFGNAPFVWINDTLGFVKRQRLAQSCLFRGSLEPWLFKVDHKQLPHLALPDLPSALGIKPEFNQSDVLSVLKEMRDAYSFGFSEGRVNFSLDLDLAVQILNWVTEGDSVLPRHLREQILVPVDNLLKLDLQPCSELMYCDAEWLRSSENSTAREHKVIHRKITHDTAYKLGVPSLSNRLAPSEPVEFEQLGPHESLTLRLSNILREYKDDAGIFKELIQNADDAGATEVSLLIDWRDGKTSSLLSPDMKLCQGPSLWAYNNATFTDADFANIAKLAGRTKEADLNKIGRFGLGFTSVYHLTDVPSFVSRNFVVIFDPHGHHLGNHIRDKSKPGVKMDFVDIPIAKRFPDQFQPYEGMFGCSVKDRKPFDGTLFRLPLRTKHQAAVSEIKSEPYGERNIAEALNALRQVAVKIMLFLNHVRQVKVYILKKDSSSPNEKKLVFEVKAKEEGMSLPTFGQSNLLEACSHLITRGRVPSSCSSSCIVSVSFTDVKREINESERWLVCSAVGQNQCLKLAKSPIGKKLGLLPFAGVASKLSSDGMKIPIPIKGEVFCFLPLSVDSGLPFHVNGFFSVLSNRRGLWWYDTESTLSDDATRKDSDAQWNHVLIKDAVLEATLTMFKVVTSLLEQGFEVENYYRLWPCVQSPLQMWGELASNFYKAVVERKPYLMHVTRTKWISLMDALLLSDDVASLPHAEELTESICSNYVKIPAECSHVVKGLRDANATYLSERTLCVKRFAEKFLLRSLTSLTPSRRDELIHGILNLACTNPNLRSILKKLDFVPCSPEGTIFRRPSLLIKQEGLAADLFSVEDSRFPFQERYQNYTTLHILEQLGMKTSQSLDWQDVTERMKSVQHLTDSKNVLQRVKAITALMENLACERRILCSPEKTAEIRSIAFLPVLNRPKEYPLSFWYASHNLSSNLVAASAKSVFYEESLQLAGSQGIILSLSYRDLKSRCASVLPLLGINRPPFPLILRQLKVALNCVAKTAEVSRSLKKLVYAIYREMDKRIEEGDIIDFAAFERHRWVLVGNILVMPSQLSFNWSGEGLSLYLYPVPSDLYDVRELLLKCGVRGKFTKVDFLWALTEMKMDKKGQQLTTKETRIAFSFLQRLAFVEDKEWRKKQRGEGEVPLISEDLRLLPASQLTYADVLWNRDPEDEEKTIYVHENYTLTGTVLVELGVELVRTRFLDDHSEEFPGREFGQHEPLTLRLENIIDAYPWGVQILKELVQNADDAQASTLHLVLDKRSHRTETVFSNNWKELQGPALLAYNDRPFSKSDLKGIQNIGEGSKRSDPSKTGQYGIGFNSVYHLTDCPSFISDDKVFCVLDPHCRFIPKATDKRPGRLYDISEKFWRKFPDVNATFYTAFDGVSLSGGTVFRFPLRNELCAVRSKISKKVVTSNSISKLLTEFAESASHLLLFLNSVTSIKLSVIEANGQRKELFFAESSLEPSAVQKRRKMFNKMAELKRVKTSEIQSMFHVTYEMSLNVKKGEGCPKDKEQKKWLVHQCIGKQSTENFSDVSDLCLLPRGGIAALLGETLRSGKAYCFLPLPRSIPIPVHVNGHFALDSARRNIFRDEDKFNQRQIWNESLIDLTIAPAYAAFLQEAKKYVKCETSKEDTSGDLQAVLKRFEKKLDWFHSLFPIYSSKGLYWDRLTQQLYRCLVKTKAPILALVNRPLPSDQVRPLSTDVDAHTPFSAKPRGLEMVKEIEKYFPGTASHVWLSLEELGETDTYDVHAGSPALYFDHHVVDGFTSVRGSAFVLKSLLLLAGFPVVATSGHIYRALQEVGKCGLEATSRSTVYDFLCKYDQNPSCKLSLGKIEATVFKKTEYVDFLLKFLFDEYGNEKALSVEKLEGLPLLVTADENLKIFSSNDYVYSSAFLNLMPQRRELFLHQTIRISAFREYNFESDAVRSLSPQELSSRLRQTTLFDFSNFSKTLDKVTDQYHGPDDKWIRTFWEYLVTEGSEIADEKSFLEAINHFKDWPLLPATSGSDVLRVPIQLGYSILNVGDTAELAISEKVLIQLGIPLLGTELVSFARNSLVNSASKSRPCKISEPDSIVKALDYHFNVLGVQGIGACSAMHILKYFNSHCDSKGSPSFEVHHLKRLPLFETVSGFFVRIESVTALCVPYDIPNHGWQIWMSATKNTVFLKRKEELKDLYSCLNLNNALWQDVYLQYILKLFHRLTDDDRIEHLLYLECCSRSYYCHWEESKVRERLEVTPCFLQDGRLLCVSCFYSPHTRLFTLMLDQKYFPPFPPKVIDKDGNAAKKERISDLRWLNFLETLGLQVRATDKKLLELASTLSREGRKLGKTEEFSFWAEKSRCLFLHLVEFRQYPQVVWEKLAISAWLPAEEIRDELSALSRPYFESSWATSFEKSVASTKVNERLCWTSRFLMPKWEELVRLSEKKRKWLKISEIPSIKDVIFNIERYSKSAALGVLEPEKQHKLKYVKEMTEVTLQTFEFLQKSLRFSCSEFEVSHIVDLRKSDMLTKAGADPDSKFAIKSLHDLKFVFIPAAGVFVSPIQIARRATEISPYFFELQDCYARFSNLLRRFGTDTEAKPFHYARVLEKIFLRNKENELNPNDLEKAVQATKLLFTLLLKHCQKRSDDPTSANSLCTVLEPLYLLNQNNKLEPSQNLVFLDSVRHQNLTDQLPYSFLIDLNKCQLLPIHEDTVDLLPEKLRPRLLSSLLGMKIKRETIVESSSGKHIELAEDLEFFLTSEHFINGIRSIHVHEHRTEVTQIVMARFKALAENFCVKCLKSFFTSVVIFESQTEVGEAEDGTVFLDEFYQAGKPTLILSESVLDKWTDHRSPNRVKVVKEIIKFLKCRIEQSVVVNILSLESPDEIPSYLEQEFNIKFVTAAVGIRFPSKPIYGRAACGKAVHACHRERIDQDYNFKFEVDEWIAYEIGDDEDCDDNYIYAKIVNKVYEHIDGDAIQEDLLHRPKYMIDIGKEEPIEADSLRMYKFMSNRPTKPSDCVELVLKEDPVTEGITGIRRTLSLEEKFSEVRRLVSDIWKLSSEDDRRRAIKRLYLKWHPDKCDDPDAEDVFKYLHARIEEGPNGTEESGWSGSFGRSSTNWGFHYDRWDNYARSHRSRSRSRGTGGSSAPHFSFFRDPPSPPQLSRDPELGSMFFDQAKADLLAAQEHYQRQVGSIVTPNFALVCFLSHECAEKALKGILLFKKGLDSERMKKHNLHLFLHATNYLPSLAAIRLNNYATNLDDTDYIRSRYPDFSCRVPAFFYSQEEARAALENAEGVRNVTSEVF